MSFTTQCQLHYFIFLAVCLPYSKGYYSLPCTTYFKQYQWNKRSTCKMWDLNFCPSFRISVDQLCKGLKLAPTVWHNIFCGFVFTVDIFFIRCVVWEESWWLLVNSSRAPMKLAPWLLLNHGWSRNQLHSRTARLFGQASRDMMYTCCEFLATFIICSLYRLELRVL